MPWIGVGSTQAPQQAAQKKAQPAKPAASLEFVTTVSSRGIAPANAVVEHLTATECRFRTVVLFHPGDAVGFQFGFGEAQLAVHGTIATRANKGPRFVYTMRLDRMSPKEIDELARAVAECHRRMAQARTEQTIRTLPTTERLTRSSLRIVSQFPITYRTPKSAFADARAGDVSTGGLLMVCGEALVQGEPVELRFKLPSDVLKAYPEETVALDLRKGTVTSSRTDPRRPFEEMVVGARVVNLRPIGNGLYSYGLAFTSIDGYQSEEIARYTNAVQRARHRHT